MIGGKEAPLGFLAPEIGQHREARTPLLYQYLRHFVEKSTHGFWRRATFISFISRFRKSPAQARGSAASPQDSPGIARVSEDRP